jgi:hypothetical protein
MSAKVTATTMDSKATSLFDLPPELRNNIYEYAFATTLQVKLQDGELLSNHALLGASRQLRSEALPVLRRYALLSAQKIYVVVNEFDFGELIRFLGSLNDEQRNAINQNHSLRLTLTLTENGEKQRDSLTD